MSGRRTTNKKIHTTQNLNEITDPTIDAPSSPFQIDSIKTPQPSISLSVSSIDSMNDDRHQPSLPPIETIKTPQRPITHSVSTASSTSTNTSTELPPIFDADEDPNEKSSPESPPESPPEEPERLFPCDGLSGTGLQANRRRSRSREENEAGEPKGKSIQDEHGNASSPSEKRLHRIKNPTAKARTKSPRLASSPAENTSLPVRGTNEPMEETIPRTQSAQTIQVDNDQDAPGLQLPRAKRRSPRLSMGRSREVPSRPESTETKDGPSINFESELPLSQPEGTETEDGPSMNVESEKPFSQSECGPTSEPGSTGSSDFSPTFTRYKEEEIQRVINAKIKECLEERNIEAKKLKKEKTPDGETSHTDLGWVYILISPKKAPGHVKIGKSKNEPTGRKNAYNKCFAVEESDEGYKNGYAHFGLVESLVHRELHNARKEFKCQNCISKGVATIHKEWFEMSEKDTALCIEKWRRWLRDYEPFDSAGILTPYWERRVEALTTELANVDWNAWTVPSSDGYLTPDYFAYWSERYKLTALKEHLGRKIPKMWVLILYILLWYDSRIGVIAGIAGLIWL